MSTTITLIPQHGPREEHIASTRHLIAGGVDLVRDHHLFQVIAVDVDHYGPRGAFVWLADAVDESGDVWVPVGSLVYSAEAESQTLGRAILAELYG